MIELNKIYNQDCIIGMSEHIKDYLKDGAELFFGVVGNNEDEILTLRTKDSKHIKLLSSLVMESWLRARKLQ